MTACPECGSERLYLDGRRALSDGSETQRFLCRACGYRFSERRMDSKRLPNITGQHQVCVILQEAKNLDSATELKTVAGETTDLDKKGQLIQFVWNMRKDNYTQSTIDSYTTAVKLLMQNTTLEPDSVKEYLSTLKCSDAYKHNIAAAYTLYLKLRGLTWRPPLFHVVNKLPFIPTEAELDQLIASVGKKTSVYLETLKQTGARMGEIASLTWASVDVQRKTITINNPEKNGQPRILNINDKLVNMFATLPKTTEYVFGTRSKVTRGSVYYRLRKRAAVKIGNPRILRIGLHTFRHWKATMLYHETKNPALVMETLGHRNLNTTMRYIHLEKALFKNEADNFDVQATADTAEIKGLLEVGFEYVCERNGLMFFRRRK